MNLIRETAKRSAGWLVSRMNRQLNYRNCVFILAHMRCGSTALSNILCSRPDVSGYGEAHVRHDGEGALGRLAINQRRRGAWKPGAPFLFDKILHNRHDQTAPHPFFDARAIFIVRRPGDAIRSIVELYRRLGRDEYANEVQAAIYYVQRLEALQAMWQRFPAGNRVGLSHESLLSDPDVMLARISTALRISPPLENRYVSPEASRIGGGGDPFVSARHDRIMPDRAALSREDCLVEVPADLIRKAKDLYEKLHRQFGI